MSSNPFEPPVIITKEFILQRVSESEIFHKYLGLVPEFNGLFCNPLRDGDSHPGCNFYEDSRGVIKFKDYAGGFNWDCFNVVEYAERTDFKGALNTIARDFNLVSGDQKILTKDKTIKHYHKREFGIRVKRREWEKKDYQWWKQFYITPEILDRYRVSPVGTAWSIYDNDERTMTKVYYYKDTDPCYCYHFEGYNYKLYFPLRPKKSVRFIQLSGLLLQGYNQLPKEGGRHLILTKSLKDVMSLSIFEKEFDLYSTAPASETVVIPVELYTELYNKYEFIGTLFDFDRAGIRLAGKYRENFHTNSFFFGSLFRGGVFSCPTGIKDFSDYIKKFGIDKTRELIDKIYADLSI